MDAYYVCVLNTLLLFQTRSSFSSEKESNSHQSYQNDMVTFKNKDDVLTALIHLGYLAYDRREQMAYIPNEEIRSEFTDAVEEHQCIIEKYEK